MKWTKDILLIGKSILMCFMIYVLLTKFNDRNLSDASQLIIYQLLYPFPSFSNESLNFLRVIMVLGLSFNSFSLTILLLSELSNASKELIRFHSTSKAMYIGKSLKCLFPQYALEFFLQLFVIVACMSILKVSWNFQEIFYIFTVWFVIDLCWILLINIYSATAIVTIVAFMVGSLVRYGLMLHVWYLLLLMVCICGAVTCRKEK